MDNLTEVNINKSTLAAARNYVGRGFKIIPIPFREKAPTVKGWQNLDITEENLPKYFNGKSQNIGVLLGEKSGGLVDIDLDAPEAVKLADWFLPETNAAFGRKSKPSSHRLYMCAEAEYQKFNNPIFITSTNHDERKNACIVEIRTNQSNKGIQTVFPPSVHESGEEIKWQRSGEPVEVSVSELKGAVGKVAAASLLAKFWRKGVRQDLALAISGSLLRHGFSEDEAKHFVKAICFTTSDEEVSKRIEAVKNTAESISKGGNVFGLPKLAELTDEKIIKSLCEWLQIECANQTHSEQKFVAPPKPLDWSLKPVKSLDLECLPKVLCNWLIPASRVIGCPIDFLILSAIVAAGSLIGARVRVKALENSDWFVVPNLYGGLVGLPSTKKTPALDEAQKPILQLQAKVRETIKTQMHDYEVEMRFYEKDLKDIYSKSRSADEAKSKIKELRVPEKPVLRRYQTNDVTTPKLIHFLSENPNGLLLFRDELAGWLRSLDNDYDKSARAFILEVWKGAISYELARVDGREIPLTSGTLSIFGGIQPSKLQRYVAEAYSFDNSDGFLQRLIFVFPDFLGKRNNPTASDFEAKQFGFENASRVYQKLAELNFGGNCVSDNGDKFLVLKFNKEAQKRVNQWKEEIETKAEKIQVNDEAFAAYLYKLPKSFFSIALIFHCLENIAENNLPDEISDETTIQALAYTDYLVSHANRVFALGENQIFDLARRLIEKIKNGELNQGFRHREILRKKWSGFRSPEEVNETLALLVDYGYLIPVGKTAGRPTTEFYFHPSLECTPNLENEETTSSIVPKGDKR